MSRRSIGSVVAVAVAAVTVTVAWLDLEGVRGSLLHRIHANRVVWRSNGREAALEDATLAWSLLWLLLATLSFHDVHVGNATVTVAKTPTKAMPGVDVQSSPVPNKRSPSLAGPIDQPAIERLHKGFQTATRDNDPFQS